MNRFFDFTSRQLKFLIALSAMLLLLALIQFLKMNASQSNDGLALPLFLGDEERVLTGLFILDPNTAPADSLELLPGIGTVIADRIVAYRMHTLFNKEIDITEVKGIGPKLFERIKPYLKVHR